MGPLEYLLLALWEFGGVGPQNLDVDTRELLPFASYYQVLQYRREIRPAEINCLKSFNQTL